MTTMSELEFTEIRKQVLAQWPTGKEVDLDKAIDYHRNLPDKKNCAKLYRKAKEEEETAFIAWGSQGDLEEHIRRHKIMQTEADVCATTCDSYTRALRFEHVQKFLDEGRAGKLNGVPIVNYGIETSRRIIEEVDVPEHLRFAGPDLRLITEIGLAAGFSGYIYQLGDFAYYSKNATPEEVIRNHQYVYKLVGYYEEMGAPIAIDLQGYGKTGLVAHSLYIATNLISALMAAEHGVKNVAMITGPIGHLIYDVAALRLAVPITEEYLRKFGHNDVTVTQFCMITPGPFPEDESRAYGVLCLAAAVIAYAGPGVVQRIGARSVAEGRGLPTAEDFVKAFRAQKQVVNMVKDQKVYLQTPDLEKESEIMELEIRSIVDKVLELGDGDIETGTIKAMKNGVLDCPFPSNERVPGKVMVVRDNTGAVRWMDWGNLPLPDEAKEYHKKKIAERERADGRPVDYDNISNDLLAVYRGQGLIGRPTKA